MRYARPNTFGTRVVDSASQHIGIGESWRFLADERNVAIFGEPSSSLVERRQVARSETRTISSR